MSFDLTVRFTGVNAYVYPSAEGQPLTVVMPNGTNLGQSPPGNLAPHFPVVHGLEDVEPGLRAIRGWQSDKAKARGVYHSAAVRYLFWERLNIRAYRKNEGGRNVEDRSIWESTRYQPMDRPLPIPASAASNSPPVEKVVSQVSLYAGSVSTKGGCKLAWSSEKSLVSSAALVDEVKVEIEGLDLAILSFESFFGGEDEILIDDGDVNLLIGNLCAGNVFQWPANDRYDFADRDFGWMYQLADPKLCTEFGPPPVPIVEQGGCRFKEADAIKDLPAKLKSHFGNRFGGGGCGCECGGCRARLIPDAEARR